MRPRSWSQREAAACSQPDVVAKALAKTFHLWRCGLRPFAGCKAGLRCTLDPVDHPLSSENLWLPNYRSPRRAAVHGLGLQGPVLPSMKRNRVLGKVIVFAEMRSGSPGFRMWSE